MLVLATLCALLVVNLGLHEPYEAIRETLVGLSWWDAAFALTVEAWINDGLMALFFLVVGIEIKREVVDGELSDPRSAALPIVAALGGMAAPAAIYALVNAGGGASEGWGVPMATDIAFTLGLLALLGSRVPASLKVLVSALAIADDLGAILVIAVFYSEGVPLPALGVAGAVLLLMLAMARARVYARWPYLALGTALWAAVFASGLHATLAGVLTALAIPTRPPADPRGVAAQASVVLDAQGEGGVGERAFEVLREAVGRLRAPGDHLQHALEGWTAYLVLPLFAFFNTGIAVLGAPFDPLAPAPLGVILGLTLGKPLGILLASGLAVRAGLARLPEGVRWPQLAGAASLAGIGFTMSIFIAGEAFEGPALAAAKLAVLIASALSAALGLAILLLTGRAATPETEMEAGR